MNSIAIWNKLPREIFQRLTKLREQEKGRQSVLFQNSSCVNLCQIARDWSYTYLYGNNVYAKD